MTDTIANPYSMDEQPTSPGRVLLARAFAHWCAIHHGLSDDEVEAALAGRDADAAVRRRVRNEARLLGELAAAGRLSAVGRPIGGGEAVELRPAVWEVDDFRARFATSAIDPRKPFDPSAAPTHWVFLDLAEFNGLVAESCGETVATPREARQPGAPPEATENRAATPAGERMLRLPEVKSRTGMSRSTIYNRIRDQAFPSPVNLGGNISAWRETEVDGWVRSHVPGIDAG